MQHKEFRIAPLNPDKFELNHHNPHQELVSVIIPTYNRAKRIGKAIESVLLQDYDHIELIIVDDGSTDETGDTLRKYPDLTVIKQQNRGQAAARQIGFQRAKGAYIASLDSDDFWESKFISRSLSALNKKRDAAFSFANWFTKTPEGDILPDIAFDMIPYLEENSHIESDYWHYLTVEKTRNLFVRNNPAPTSSLLIKREFITHGWRPSVFIDDWALLLDLVLDQSSASCVYTADRLWTKQIDGSNINDRHIDSVALCDKNLQGICALFDLHKEKLTNIEIQAFKQNIELRRFDLTYAMSITQGYRRSAIVSGFECLRNQPNCSTALLFLKSLIKSYLGLKI